MKPKFHSHFLSLAGTALLALTIPAAAQSAINWATAASGDWATGSNWTGGSPPANDTTTNIGLFDDIGTYTVSLTANRSAAQLRVATGTPTFSFGSFTLTAPNTFIGFNGASGTASLTSGTISSATSVVVGYGSTDSTFTVDNAALTGGGIFYAGRSISASLGATGAQLTLQNGATATAGTVYVGYAGHQVAVNNNKLTVTGAGSTLTASGEMWVGALASGTSGAQSTGNELVVNNGGDVSVTGAVRVGHRSTGSLTTTTGNKITVGGTGTGSLLTLGNVLHVGQFNGNNTVTVNAGGKISATAADTTVFNQTSNRLEVAGGEFDATGRTVLVNRELTISSGTLKAGTLQSDSSGGFTPTLSGGSLEAGTLALARNTFTTVGDGTGVTMTVKLSGTGTHTVGAGLVVSSDGVFEAAGTLAATTGSTSNHAVLTGGQINPGGSSLATLAFDMNTTTNVINLQNGAKFNMGLGTANVSIGSIASGSSDLISILNATANDVVFSSGTPGGNVTIDFANSATGLGFYKLFDTNTDNANTWTGLTYDGTTGVVSVGLSAANIGGGYNGQFIVGTASNGAESVGDIYFQVIPEPSSAAMLVAALGGLALRRRRRN